MFDQQADGSIIIKDNFPLTIGFLTKWKQDESNPRRFHLIFKPCKARHLTVVTLSCGKKVCDYQCHRFGKPVSPSVCHICEESVE